MEKASVVNGRADESLDLPTGFRFKPTDEEIVTHYLTEKVVNNSFMAIAIAEVDLNKCEPWDLPKKAKMGETEYYFFCQRERRYPTGMRTNRATESGYWKATGKDKEIYKGKKGGLIGMKKTLVFYKGRAPKGEKTNWVMHEFRLEGNLSYYNLPRSAKDNWVVCRVFHKNTGIKRSPSTAGDLLRMNSFDDCEALPPLMEPPYSNGEEDYSLPSAKSTEGNYLSYFSNPINDQQPQKPLFFPNNYNYQPAPGNEQSQFYPPYTFPSSQSFQGNFENAILRDRQCKVEQFSSNQSMVSLSQDTGLSTDMNPEISSVGSKRNLDIASSSSYDNLDVPSELDCLWNY